MSWTNYWQILIAFSTELPEELIILSPWWILILPFTLEETRQDLFLLSRGGTKRVEEVEHRIDEVLADGSTKKLNLESE